MGSDVDLCSEQSEGELALDFAFGLIDCHLGRILASRSGSPAEEGMRGLTVGADPDCTWAQPAKLQTISEALGPKTTGRFTSRRVRGGASAENQAPSGQAKPGRLEGAIGGYADPFSQTTCARQASPWNAHAVHAGGAMDFRDLPAFQHLDALERAVHSGAALEGNLPSLPSARGNLTPDPCQVSDGKGPASPLRSARGGPGRAPAAPGAPLRAPLSSRGSEGPLSSAGQGLTGRRILFREGDWGVEPPLPMAARKHAGAPPLGYSVSALTGKPLPRTHRGSASTARWLATESDRLRSEPRKTFGSSATFAFFQNGGPEHMEHLNSDLVRPHLLH